MPIFCPYQETLQFVVSPTVNIEKNALLPFSTQIGWQSTFFGALQASLLLEIGFDVRLQPIKIELITLE